MNICFISKDQPWKFSSGGISTYLESISSYLASQGHHVHIISLSYGKEEDYDICGVHIHGIKISDHNKKMRFLKKMNYFFMRMSLTHVIENIIIYKRFRELDKMYDFDVIESDDVSGSSMFVTLFCNKPVITRAHGSSFLVAWFNNISSNTPVKNRLQLRLMKLMEGIQYKHSALVLANSKTTMHTIQKMYHLNTKNLAYLYLPIVVHSSVATAQEKEYVLQSLQIKTPFILYTGRIEHRKGLYILADAIGPVLRRHPKFHLYIIGFNTEEHTVTIIKHFFDTLSDVRERIHFRPAILRAQVYALMQCCEFLVLPSIMEPFGYTCSEAMIVGTLVVAADGSGYEEQIVRSGVNGLLFKNKDARSLELQMECAITMPLEEKNQIIRNAQERQKQFQSESILKEHLAVYYTIAAGKAHLLKKETIKEPNVNTIENFWGVDGAFEIELDHGIPYRWLTKESKLWIPRQKGDYFILRLFSPFPDLEQVIEIWLSNKKVKILTLLNDWHWYVVKRKEEEYIIMRAKKALPQNVDERILAVRISAIEITDTMPPECKATEKKIMQLMHEQNEAKKNSDT